jgi:hypothetical protein
VVVEEFKGTRVLEHRSAERATILPAGPLPARATFNRNYDKLLWITEMPCDAVGNPAKRDAWVAQLIR